MTILLRRGIAWCVFSVAIVSNTSAQSTLRFAIVPFTNTSGVSEHQWIGAGIAETLSMKLETIIELDVIPNIIEVDSPNHRVDSESTLLTWPKTLDLARNRGASILITGDQQQSNGHLRFTARLIDLGTGTEIDTIDVEGTVENVFLLQDKLSEATLKAIEKVIHAKALNSLANDEGENSSKSDSPSALSIKRPSPRRIGDIKGLPPATMRNPHTLPSLISLKTTEPASTVTNRPIIRARRASKPPTIDGILKESIWTNAALINDFTQTNPVEGAIPTETTEVRVTYDDDNLYFGFHAQYTDPGQMRANHVDRDQIRRDDWIAVMFDTFQDQQRAYRFSVNPFGVQGDAIIEGGRRMRGPPGGGGDTSWNALFESSGVIVHDGWTAEVAIPFKSLRYPDRGDAEHTWGFQITRTLQTKDETLVWSPMTRNIAGVLPQMGTLTGLSGLSASRNLEILPTATAIQLGELTDTEYVDGDVQPDIGLNVKYGVKSNLTADFTFNPDFSQIESDRPQIEVNRRFPLFFPELRPFFLEGQEIFSTPGRVNLVHTRTIVDPQLGAKLTGKTGKATLGVLVTNDESAGNFEDRDQVGFGQDAKVLIGRARYDLYSESYVGAIVTDREFLESFSRVAGIDGRFRIGQTHSAEFIAVASSNRDLNGVAKNGPLFDFGFRRDSRRLSYRLQYNSIDPEFGTAAGFVRRVDTRRLDADIEYDWWPEHWLISWGPGFSYMRNVDHSGVLQDEEFRTDLSFRFKKNIFLRADARREMEHFQSIDFYKTRFSMRNGISSNRRFSVFYSFNWGNQIRFIDNPFLGKAFEYDVNLTILPTSRLSTQFSIDTSRFTDARINQRVFDVKILRTFTTYQFTNRLLVRNILEHNTGNGKVGVNLLITYRVNAGTVFYIGYDDRLQEGIFLDRDRFYSHQLQRQRRAFFTKFQFLFRY